MVIARGTRWLRAALIAPLLAFALSASSHLAVRCTVSGVLMPESCCPDATSPAVPGTPGAGATLRDADCCQRVTVATAKAPAAGVGPARLWVASLPIASVTAVARRPAADRPAAAVRAVRAPGEAPPLYVATHSFLI